MHYFLNLSLVHYTLEKCDSRKRLGQPQVPALEPIQSTFEPAHGIHVSRLYDRLYLFGRCRVTGYCSSNARQSFSAYSNHPKFSIFFNHLKFSIFSNHLKFSIFLHCLSSNNWCFILLSICALIFICMQL